MIVFPFSFIAGTESGPGPTTFENYYSNDFDGTNDYVDLGTELNSMFEIGDSFSVSAWVKFGNTATDRTIISNFTSGTKGLQLRVRPAEQVRWVFAQTPSVYFLVDTTTLSVDTWHHIVATYDGSNATSGMNIYVNGNLDNDSTDAAGTISDMTSTDSLKIGKNTGGQFYTGDIDEVAIFDSELSASDVTSIYNGGTPANLASQSNLKGWWRMGDGANYPIVKNQAHFSQTALDFDGSNDAVFITDSGVVPAAFQGMGNSSNYSFSCWIKTGTSAGAGTYWYCPATIVEIRTETSSGTKVPFSFGIGSNKLWLGRTSNHLVTDEGEYSTDLIVSGAATWKHVAFTMNGDDYVFYINGSASGSGSFTTATGDCSVGTTTSNFVIGSRTTNAGALSSPFNGEIDDCSFYNTTLSASDITDIYNSGYPKDESERSGLLTYYKFDGDVYPVVQDETEFSNASLDFDGTDDYIDCGEVSALASATAFTISGWFNQTTLDEQRFMFGTRVSNSNMISCYTWNDGKMYVDIRNGGTSYADFDYSTVVTAGKWFHLAMVYDGSAASNTDRVKLYIDGSAVTLSYVNSFPASTNAAPGDFRIGSLEGFTAEWLGKIDDVSIYSSALSASDVTGIYNSGKPKDESSTSNVVGYWRMGDNTISPNVPSALGYGTHSVDFDGTDDYITAPISALNSVADCTISFWFKLDATSDKMMVGDYIDGSNGIWLYWDGTTWYFSPRNGSGVVSTTYTWTGKDTNWHHITGVKSGTGGTIYIDGTSVSTGTASATLTSATGNNFQIGALTGASLYANGNIAQVGIFNVELSASDVTSIYNNGLPKDILSESGLVSYYRMGDGEDKYPNILDYKGTNHGTMTNMATDDITTANVGSGAMTNMTSDNIVADTPAGTSGQMTNMASDDFVAAKGAGTMTNMDAEDIVAETP